jgi:hypothetical protein
MFAALDHDPDPGQVRRMTFVPFLEDGQCVLVEQPGGPALPSGDVRPGEDYLFDTVLRCRWKPLASAISDSAPSAWTTDTCTPGSRARRIPAVGRMRLPC